MFIIVAVVFSCRYFNNCRGYFSPPLTINLHLLTQASNSVVQNRGAEAKQDLQLALASVETAYYTKWASNSATTRDGNAGVYADATDGLQKQLENAGYTNVSINVTNLFTAAGSEISIQKGSDVFNFKNVSVDKDSGSFSYVVVSPATTPVLEVVSGSKPAETIEL